MKKGQNVICKIVSFTSKLRTWSGSRNVIASLFIASLSINLLSLAFPLALLQIYDRIIANNAFETLFMLCLIVLIALIFEAIFKVIRFCITSWSDAKYEYELSMKSIKTILNAEWSEFSKTSGGIHLYRLNALNNLRDFYGNQVIITLMDIPFVAIYLALIAYIGGPLVIIPIAAIGLFLLVGSILGKKINNILDDRRRVEERRINFIIDTLNAFYTIKSMAMEALMLRRYECIQHSSSHSDYELSTSSALASNFTNLVIQLNTIGVVSLGSYIVLTSQMSLGAVVACTLLANKALQPLNKSIGIWKRLQSINIAEKRIEKLLDMPSEYEKEENIQLDIKGDIEFENVSIKHKSTNTTLLEDVNLTIKHGETIALTGRGQAGKTTLLNMILGLEKPATGTVKIDGEDITRLDPQHLRSKIGYMPQNGELFNGNVVDNINFFKGKNLQDHALEISREIGIDEQINHLQHGYKTQIGNSTIDFLPAGLRQRIIITRELAAEPKIILFDEANSGVDNDSDKKIIETLMRLKGSCTLIIVTHRPSYLRLADKVYTILNKRLIEKKAYEYQDQHRA